MANIFANVVDRVVIETEWLPPIEIPRPFGTAVAQPGGAAPGSSLDPNAPKPTGINRMLKPRVSIYSTLTSEPITMAPYGEPASNWPYLRLLIFLSAGIAMVTSVRTWQALRDCRAAKRGKGLKGLCASPEVHDREGGTALSRIFKGRLLTQKILNKADRYNDAKRSASCKRAYRTLASTREAVGRWETHTNFRDDPHRGAKVENLSRASVGKAYKAALRDAEDYFVETCLLGEALTADQYRLTDAVMRDERKQEIDRLIATMPKIPGVRGKLRLVQDDE